MIVRPAPGLGELLRYVGELVDRGAGEVYDSLGMSYRPRYTPVLRAMSLGAKTVTEITAFSNVTQGAISQTIGLMVADGLVVRVQLPDARKSGIQLTTGGRELVEQLKPHWENTFAAITELESEIGFPLRQVLGDAAAALERTGFAARLERARRRRTERDDPLSTGATPGRNWFDRDGRAYAQFRPEYPARLSMFLASLAPSTALAVDVGCGSGQLTSQLAPYFATTIGVDPSAEQIEHAPSRERVRYLHASAERLPIPGRSASLVTAAQAAHWFDRPTFYAEVRRIAVEGAVIALISYGVVRLEPELEERFTRFYHKEIGPFWPPERALVDSGYADIDFPFDEYPAPAVRIEKHWTLDEFMGYLSTWSAVRRAQDADRSEVLHTFAADLAELWGEPTTTRRITWPLNIRVGIL
ncbi:methyltransferase domain-containing protein [Nocardia abscessus]|uniref:methyltransferase domain-containing protein n=1 Tax=Nocardia abscessus TaxID=120957 RepID=UPI002B4B7C39|nr:methyltransferase domain-containing protein [Nocardia abscessus]